MERPLRVLSESEAKPESFHDCHVHGLRWLRDRFSFSMDLQYILEWIEPSGGFSGFRFSICEGVLTFRNVDDLRVSMDWSGAALDSQIGSLQVLKTRATPNGATQRYFEIEFSDPEAFVSLWSTGYEVELLGEPVVSDVTGIPPCGGP
jgi:hypothetical protein